MNADAGDAVPDLQPEAADEALRGEGVPMGFLSRVLIGGWAGPFAVDHEDPPAQAAATPATAVSTPIVWSNQATRAAETAALREELRQEVPLAQPLSNGTAPASAFAIQGDDEVPDSVPRTDAAFLASKVHFDRLVSGMAGNR